MPVILGQQRPAAATEVDLHPAISANSSGILDIDACNTGAGTAQIRIAVVSTGGSRTYLEYDLPLYAAGSGQNALHRTGFKAPAGTVVKVQSSTGFVDFTLNGVEE